MKKKCGSCEKYYNAPANCSIIIEPRDFYCNICLIEMKLSDEDFDNRIEEDKED